MQVIAFKKTGSVEKINSSAGFTLVEILVAMVIGLIVMGVIFGTHNIQQRTFRQESLKLATIQNARAALAYLEQEIRLAGYDRPNSGLFGLTGIAPGSITFTYDLGGGGNTDNGSLDGNETVSYFLWDSPDTPGTGSTDLGRSQNGVTELVAEGIRALGFAYAYDNDNDGALDFHDADADGIRDPGEFIIWASDRNGDGDLDRDLDGNADGEIDINDAPFDLNLPGAIVVPRNRIRAVKVMLLAQSKQPDLNYQDTKNYWVGIGAGAGSLIIGDSYHRRMLTTTIRCRNLGL